MRNVFGVIAICLIGQPALADETRLSTALTMCSDASQASETVLDQMRSSGWAAPDAADQQKLAGGLQLGSLLYDHMDSAPAALVAAQSEFVAGSAGIIQNVIDKTVAPFDTLNAHILAAPDGTVAEMTWSDVGGKIYFSCRISPAASVSFGDVSSLVETVFVDPYLERADTTGTNGSKSVWNDYDNEQIYIYSVNRGVLGPDPLISVQTLVSPEG